MMIHVLDCKKTCSKIHQLMLIYLKHSRACFEGNNLNRLLINTYLNYQQHIVLYPQIKLFLKNKYDMYINHIYCSYPEDILSTN